MKKVIVMAVLAVFAFAVAVEAAQQQTSAQSAAAKDVAKTVPTTTTKVEQKPCKPNKDGTPCIGTPPSGQSGKPKEEKKKENPKTEKTSTKTISDKLDGYIAENLKANGVEPTPANIVAVKATSLTLWLDIKNILNKNAAEKTLKTLQMLDKGEISADQKAQAEKFVQNVIEATYHDKPDTVIKKEAINRPIGPCSYFH